MTSSHQSVQCKTEQNSSTSHPSGRHGQRSPWHHPLAAVNIDDRHGEARAEHSESIYHMWSASSLQDIVEAGKARTTERERERERKRDVYTYVYKHIYTHIYIYT